MKIKSLLAAVSMVALTTGTASALSIPQTPATGPTPANVMVPEGAVLANELALPADGIGSVIFSVQTDSGDYPSGNNFLIEIALPTGVAIDGPISGSVLAGTSQGAGTGSAVVQTQSATGVTLFVSIPQGGAPIDRLDFDLPLSLASCAVSGNMIVSVQTEGGTPVESGVASAISPIAPCASAFDTDFDADAADTVIGLALYEQLKDTAGGALVSTSTIGLYDALIDTMVGVNLAGDPLTAASIDEVTFDICFTDGSEISDVVVNGVAGVASTDGNTYSFTLPFSADLTDAIIDVTVEGDDPIASQSVLVKNVTADFTDAGGPDLIGSEAHDGGYLDALQREGQFFGDFDWNSGGQGAGTVSVYRITGLPVSATVPFTAVLSNSNANGTVNGSVTSDATGEAVLVSTDLNGALPAGVVRYDFGINLETGNFVDIDRLLIRNGVVSAYNDGANSNDDVLGNDPGADSDN